MYRGRTQTDYQNKHYSINQKDEGTQDDRGRDGGTNFILRIKEQETCLTLQEHNDDDEAFLPPWHRGSYTSIILQVNTLLHIGICCKLHANRIPLKA